MVAGRWKSITTPLHYRHLSDKFRQQVAARIPQGSAEQDGDVREAAEGGARRKHVVYGARRRVGQLTAVADKWQGR